MTPQAHPTQALATPNYLLQTENLSSLVELVHQLKAEVARTSALKASIAEQALALGAPTQPLRGDNMRGFLEAKFRIDEICLSREEEAELEARCTRFGEVSHPKVQRLLALQRDNKRLAKLFRAQQVYRAEISTTIEYYETTLEKLLHCLRRDVMAYHFTVIEAHRSRCEILTAKTQEMWAVYEQLMHNRGLLLRVLKRLGSKVDTMSETVLHNVRTSLTGLNEALTETQA